MRQDHSTLKDHAVLLASISPCRLYHRSPIWTIIHDTCSLCTSLHRTTFRTTIIKF